MRNVYTCSLELKRSLLLWSETQPWQRRQDLLLKVDVRNPRTFGQVPPLALFRLHEEYGCRECRYSFHNKCYLKIEFFSYKLHNIQHQNEAHTSLQIFPWTRMKYVHSISMNNAKAGLELKGGSYVYRTVHHLDSWIKRDQLDVTCFFISLFNAQHVSDFSTSNLRRLRFMCWVISWVVSLCYDVCWCYGVVRLVWCVILMQAEALLQPFHYLLLNMFRMLVHPSSGACD